MTVTVEQNVACNRRWLNEMALAYRILQEFADRENLTVGHAANKIVNANPTAAPMVHSAMMVAEPGVYSRVQTAIEMYPREQLDVLLKNQCN